MGYSVWLEGGAGRDVLTGGAGADAFVFDTGFGRDRITDFGAEDIVMIREDFFTPAGDEGWTEFLLAHAVQIDTRVEIAFSATDVLRIDDFSLSDLSAQAEQFGMFVV